MAIGLVVLAVGKSVVLAFIAAATTAATIGTLLSLEIGIFALILIACTDGMLKGLYPGWYTQVLKDYFLVLCMLRWGWLSVLGHRRLSVRHPIVPALLVFVGWCAMQMFNPHGYNWILALAGFRGWVIWIAVFFIAYDYLESRRQVERLVLFIILLLIPISIYGIVQYQIGYGHLERLGPGFDPYRRAGYFTETYEVETRPAATMVSPGNLGAGLSCVLLMAIGAALYFGGRRRLQLLALAAIPLFATAMFLTGSRAPLAGTIVGALALLVVSRRPRVAIILAVAALIAITQTSKLTGGALETRLSSLWVHRSYTRHRIVMPLQTAVNYTKTHFLGSGVGVGSTAGRLLATMVTASTPAKRKVPSAEGDFGRALLELGLPGLVIFLWMLYSVVRAMIRAYASLQRLTDRWLVAGMFGACVGVLTRLLVGSSLYVWPESIFFWLFVAAVTKLPELGRAEGVAASEQRMQAQDAPEHGPASGQQRPTLRAPAATRR